MTTPRALRAVPAAALAPPLRGLLTPDDAAAYLGVPPATLRYWTYRVRSIAHYSLGQPGKRGALRFKKADLDAFIARGLRHVPVFVPQQHRSSPPLRAVRRG